MTQSSINVTLEVSPLFLNNLSTRSGVKEFRSQVKPE
jgi:hypothetical protein